MSEVGNSIYFANDILKTKTNKGKQKVYYSLRKYKKMSFLDILTDISEHVTLVKLMDYLGNMNHSISVIRYWIFYSNYEKALVFNREYLDTICALSVGEKQVATFERVFCAVRYIHSEAYPKKE